MYQNRNAVTESPWHRLWAKLPKFKLFPYKSFSGGNKFQSVSSALFVSHCFIDAEFFYVQTTDYWPDANLKFECPRIFKGFHVFAFWKENSQLKVLNGIFLTSHYWPNVMALTNREYFLTY